RSRSARAAAAVEPRAGLLWWSLPSLRSLLLDRLAGALCVALPLATGGAHADARGLVVGGVEQHHVGDVDRPLLLDDPARLSALLRVLHRARTLVPFDHVQPLHVHASLPGIGAQHPAGLAAFLAAGDHHRVVLADPHGLHCYRTSGASETIFMKFRSLSSRATGPKIRVPRGLRCGSISTAAFSSNAMYVPSERPSCFLVRTTTACTTSPLRTPPWGAACLTVAVITSPTLA